MGFCAMEVENIDTEIIEDKDKIAAFKEKWKSIIDLFEGDFFTVEDGGDSYSQKGKVRLFTRQDTSINSRKFSTLDDGKPNKDRAFARFFSQIIEKEGDCAFGFGQEGFSSDFYKDLLGLCEDEHASWCANADCGDGGYYSGTFELGESGLYKSFTYYESEDDDDYEEDDDY